MSRLTINLEALRHNLSVINDWVVGRGAVWTAVTKVLCGHRETILALQAMGVRSIGDSRLENLEAIERQVPDFEAWYLRCPAKSQLPKLVRHTDVSLNSEIDVITALSREAARQGRRHYIVIMIELGDLREGILPGSLVHFYERVFQLPNIRVLGIGANLGCLAGAVPTVDQFMQLVLYKELLELKFHRRLPIISAGSSVSLPMLIEGEVPKGINHFRIGESLFLGTDLRNGGELEALRDDVVVVEAEIVEIKEKGLTPLGETSNAAAPFDKMQEDLSVGQRGYRAIVNIGHLDTDMHGLTSADPRRHIAGASSDVSVINIGDDAQGLKVGDRIGFRPNYSALLRLMSGHYVEKRVEPPLEEFMATCETPCIQSRPILENLPESLIPQPPAESPLAS